MAASHYTPERMRCLLCGRTFTADVLRKPVVTDEAGESANSGYTIHTDHVRCPECGSDLVELED